MARPMADSAVVVAWIGVSERVGDINCLLMRTTPFPEGAGVARPLRRRTAYGVRSSGVICDVASASKSRSCMARAKRSVIPDT